LASGRFGASRDIKVPSRFGFAIVLNYAGRVDRTGEAKSPVTLPTEL
jgi:hypothetical protein